MAEPEAKVDVKEQQIVRLTQREWSIVIYTGAGLVGLIAVGVVIGNVAGADVLRSVAVGVGAGALSVFAAMAIARSFGRAVMRTPQHHAAGAVTAKTRPTIEGPVPGAGRQLKGVDLRGANLVDTRLDASDLGDVRLDGANLAYASIRAALLSRSRLTDATLHDASLGSADLRGADLTRADMTRADLRDANLTGARLEGALLLDAVLEGAVFSDADLRGADVTGALLKGANLGGADCRGMVVDPEQLDEQQTKQAVMNYEQPSVTEALMEVRKHVRPRVKGRNG